MKKLIICAFTFLSFSLLFSSCTKEDISFDETLLYGKWVSTTGLHSGSVYYKYLSDGTGGTWDEADNVFESEAQGFTWTLVKSDLTQIHLIGGTPQVPKVYTVTELTATSLKYHDDFGVSSSFSKVVL
jgi:hypothetical protein